jgi:hypothetical protein
MRERDVVPLQAALVDALGQMPDLLIEKVRRLPRNEGMIEISAKWLGLDSDQGEVVRILRDSFPEQALGIEDLLFWVGPSDEVVLLMFAGRHEGRFLTGRMLVGF